MAIAISAIMLEQTGNMDSVILMMVTVLSSRMVAGMLAPQSFTDEVIKQKGYQVLEPREPPIMSRLTAGDVCTRDVVALRPDEDVASIVRALRSYAVAVSQWQTSVAEHEFHPAAGDRVQSPPPHVHSPHPGISLRSHR